MTYTFLRHMADSWGLLAMFIFVLGVAVFAFRPGSSRHYRHAAQIPLKDDGED